MDSLRRLAKVSAFLCGASFAAPCLAMPPVGYVGPAPEAALPETAPIGTPPLGYVGPAPVADGSAFSAASEPPPSAPPAKPKPPEPAVSPAKPKDQETLISAKEMHSNAETGVVTAEGNVEVVHGDYILHADKVIYDQKADVMAADGNVALLLPSGEVEFADHQEITGDMKQAFALNVGILFPDNSRMAAKTGERFNERFSLATKALYTACNVCRENPDEEPLWQVRADTVTHDNELHKLYYHNAVVDFVGVPIVYTPYMSAPDPSVKRLQGFLAAVPGVSPNIGTFLRVPYYIDIAPDIDMTVMPTFSTTDKLQTAVQYRQRWEKSSLVFEGSVTKADLVNDRGVDEGQQWRGHVFGTFRTDLDNIWRAGSDIQYASDKSYLARYSISSIDQTTSRAYVEGFKRRDYAVVNSYYFQDLRAGTDVAEPVVLPSAMFSALGDPGKTFGGRWSFAGNTLVTTRDNGGLALNQQGPDTRRLSLNAGWQRQLISATGLETTISGLVRTDSYWANNVVTADKTAVYDTAIFTRPFAQANAIFRYPMGRSGRGFQHLLEPIAALTLAPQIRRIAKQPLEDSQDIEFDETNLFSPNRFPGSDLVEGGSRVTYGLRNAITGDNGARIDVFGGQSYNFTSNDGFSEQSGLGGHLSDYVGRIDFTPADWFYLNYGFRLSHKDFTPQRQDAYISAGVPIFRPAARYMQAFQMNTASNQFEQNRQITFSISSNFAKYWTITGSHTQAFDPQPGPRTSGIALSYVDECFAFGVNLTRDNTNRVDISSGTAIAFHFYFKNLGGLHTDSATGINFPSEFRQTAP